MPKPIVFVSHSSRDPGDAERMAALCNALEGLSLTIRLDRKDLVVGEQYRPPIHEWMHECRAAVIALSPEALGDEEGAGSREVMAEAAVLANRKAVAPGFVLIPVLVGTASYATLKRPDWSLFGFSDRDAVQWADGAPVPQALVDRLAEVAATYPGDSPRERFERKITTDLIDAGVLQSTLEVAAERLALTELHRWPAGEERTLIFVRRLLESSYEKQLAALDSIADTHPDLAERVLAKVMPYGWIDEVAAKFLLNVAAAAHGCRGVGINSHKVETADMYVKRATWPPVMVKFEDGRSHVFVEETADRAREALSWALLGHKKGTVEQVQAAFPDSIPIFLLMPDLPEKDDLIELRQRFPAPTIVVLCGDETEEEFTQRGLPHVLYLRPPVRRDHEDEVESAREEKLSSWQMRARYSQ